jgi:hypothetical protein
VPLVVGNGSGFEDATARRAALIFLGLGESRPVRVKLDYRSIASTDGRQDT